MKETETIKMLRREFLASSSFLLLGAGSLKASALTSQTAPKGSDLSEELNSAELEIVNNSIMARDMDNFWHKGYNCAESGLMVALRLMKKAEDLVWVAGGFGGGIGHQDLCGFLTAGIMAIGLNAGSLKIEKKRRKNVAAERPTSTGIGGPQQPRCIAAISWKDARILMSATVSANWLPQNLRIY